MALPDRGRAEREAIGLVTAPAQEGRIGYSRLSKESKQINSLRHSALGMAGGGFERHHGVATLLPAAARVFAKDAKLESPAEGYITHLTPGRASTTMHYPGMRSGRRQPSKAVGELKRDRYGKRVN